MNILVSKFINSYLADLPWVDKIGEVVRAVNIPYNTAEGQVIKTFPVSCGVSHNDCISGRFADLIPNAKYRSILYYEDGGTRFVGIENKYQLVESALQMVCWLNLKMLGQSECDISSLIITDIVNKLPIGRNVNYGNLIGAQLRIINQEPRTRDVFGRYTYADYTQYLMHPYDFFALNLQVNYKIGLNCTEYEAHSPSDC